MENILVINVNWIGDAVFSSPVFKALKSHYPNARVSCLAVPRVRDILESIPFIDEVIPYDEKGKHWYPWEKLKLVFSLKKRHFDAVFLLHGSWTRALLAYWAGIPIRVGYDKKNRGRFLTHPLALPSSTIHRADYYLNIIEDFGIQIKDRNTVLSVDVDADQSIDKILGTMDIDSDDFLIVIHPVGNWNLKRWPQNNFKLLCARLPFNAHVKVVFTGTKDDKKIIDDIIKDVANKPLNLAGKLSLKELIALLNKAHLVISADSGPLHVANSLGTTTIGLYGPTNQKITGLRGHGSHIVIQKDVGCNREACYYQECPQNTCMQAITVDDVMGAVQRFYSPLSGE